MSDNTQDLSWSPAEPDDRLIDRYLAGECLPAEAARVDAWLAERHPDAVADAWAVAAVRAQCTASPREQISRDPSALAVDLMRRGAVHAASPRPLGVPLSRELQAPVLALSRTWRIPLIAGMAAALAIVAVTFSSWSSLLPGRAVSTIGAVAYATQRGERSTVTLPDGSRAMLAPQTQLRITTDPRGAVTVELRGQAFFTVTHDPSRPLVIRTGTTSTRVLGTAFDVRRYPDDSVLRVAVVTGRVMAHGHGASAVLTAGMVGRITDSTAAVTVGNDTTAMTSWTRGELTFVETPVPVMLATLGRWLGYDFRIADSTLARQHVTASLPVREPQQALHLLRGILNVTFTVDDTTITLHSPPSAKTAHPASGRNVRTPLTLPLSEVGK